MSKSKHIKKFKTEEEMQDAIKRKQYIQDRDNMKNQYYKNVNIK